MINANHRLPFGLTVSRLLQLMITVPVIVVLVFAFRSITDQMERLRQQGRTQSLTDVAVATEQLVYELEHERGRSVGFVADGRVDGADALESRRTLTDEAAAAFDSTVPTIEVAANSDLARAISAGTQQLSQLAEVRRGVDGGSEVTSDDVVSAYSEMVRPLTEIVLAAANASSDPDLARLLMAFGYVVKKTEVAGQERALLNGIFTRDTVTSETRNRAESLADAQDLYGEVALSIAPMSVDRIYHAALGDDAINRVLSFRELLLTGQQDQLGADPEEWWRVSSAVIDLHGTVVDRIAEIIRTDVSAQRRSTIWSLVLVMALTVMAVVATVLIPFLVAGRVNRVLMTMSGAARKSSDQIAAAVNQVTSGANETASAVTETTSTVEEIRQTSELAAEKAQDVVDATDRVTTTMTEALDAVRRGVEAMQGIRTEVENIAENILSLSERNIQIGEIIETVNAIAEQSNLLAVNASIEAAKAGEYGKGFSVVAGEVKALATQSQEATAQIRSILAEIQKASNSAVMVTEQGVKRVEEGGGLIDELGQTIQRLGEVIEQSADSSQQILLSAKQQAAGIEQVTAAMRNIEQAVNDAVSAGEQLARASTEVDSVSKHLNELITGDQRRERVA